MSVPFIKQLFSDCWPTRVKIPLNAYIDDPRVVRMNNVLKYISWAFAIYIYAFIFKGYTKEAHVELNYNAWMDEYETTRTTASYCNNRTFDYVYSKPSWMYENIGCSTYPINKIFTKSIVGDTFWISSMYQDEVSHICLSNDTRPTCQQQQTNDLVPQNRSTTFVMDVGNYPLTITIRATVKQIQFDSSKETNVPLSFLLPNGTEIEIPNHLRNDGKGILIRMTINEWLNFFQIDGGLDGTDPTKTGYGNPINRITGLGMNVKIKLTNQPLSKFEWTTTTRAVLELQSEFDWKRTTIPARPTGKIGELLTTDNYGIRFKLLALPSEVKLFHIGNCVSSLFDVVIFFTVMKVVVRAVALFFLGTVSEKWRHAVTQHVDVHILLKRESDYRLQCLKKCNVQAKILLARIGKQCLKDTQNNASPSLQNEGIAMISMNETTCNEIHLQNVAIFQKMDQDKDGSVDIDELAMVMDEFQFKYSEDELRAMMAILDRDGSGTFTLPELKKTIRRSMMEIDDTVLIAEEKKQLDRLAGNVLQGDSVLTEEEILNWKEKELIEKVVNTEIKQVDTSEEEGGDKDY